MTRVVAASPQDSPCVDSGRVKQLAVKLEDEARNIISRVRDVVHTLEHCMFLEWARICHL